MHADTILALGKSNAYALVNPHTIMSRMRAKSALKIDPPNEILHISGMIWREE
jgi:hypothetical protein